jgi:pimeloyl-ACP methyl ester carboxylesterase
MKFTAETTENGVVERLFELTVNGDRVPGVLWSPPGAQGPRPLLLMGHGGGQSKRAPGIAARAPGYVRKLGYAVAAVDAPGHGDRVSLEEAAQARADAAARVGRGLPPFDGAHAKLMAERNRRAVPEWNATLGALQEFDFIGRGPVGYWGVSMGALIGAPFVAQQPRITAAIFGLAGLGPGNDELEAAARAISIPLQFIFQWEDELVSHEAGFSLFNAFGSKEKTMHINPGPHVGVPRFEGVDWENFYIRHLGTADRPGPQPNS